MSKILVVLDKDGTLTEPISGATFPQSPTDQRLMPGVPEALALLKDDRYVLAIASNQGGCDGHKVQASQVKIGNYIVHQEVKSVFCVGNKYLVEQINPHNEMLCFQYDRPRPNSKSHSVSFPESEVRISYKSIESAIEEVTIAAELCGIDFAAFCPTMDGGEAILMRHTGDRSWIRDRVMATQSWRFRKPQPGMLLSLEGWINWKRKESEEPFTHRVMIGDRPEDRAAAIAAGFIFLDAEEWRSGVTVEQAIDRASARVV